MKRLLLFLFLLVYATIGVSQKDKDSWYATIYIMRTGSSAESSLKSTISIPNQKSFNLGSGGIVEYKVYSKGEVRISASYEAAKGDYTCNVHVKPGRKYYVCLTVNEFKEEPKEYVESFLKKKWDKIEKYTEDPDSPIVKNPLDQEYSTIYLFREDKNFDPSVKTSIHIANQAPFNLNKDKAVEYKVFSEGVISIAAYFNMGQGVQYYTLKASRGHEYYLAVSVRGIEKLDAEEVEKIYEQYSDVTEKLEENVDVPINESAYERRKQGKGQGTCFLISGEGYFITNYHCVANSKEITVKGIDGDYTSKYGVSLIASDPSNDLALLKLNNKNIKLSAPVFGIRGAGVMQAEKIYVLGYPKAKAMGEEIKITEGIISSKSGAQGDISKFQITAAVNPGNSGGPLLDENGNLIGVIYAKSAVAESAGYAIKASYLETFLKNIDGFNYPTFVNTIQEKTLTEKVSELKNFVFILESD